jgi:uncharacterized membrane protein
MTPSIEHFEPGHPRSDRPSSSILQSRPWQLFFYAVVIVGIFFRFYHLDTKVYWSDEALTLLRVSGNTLDTITNGAFTGQPISVADLLAQYQYPNPDRSFADVIQALAGNAEHSPLYYLMARGWLQIFPHSVGSIRCLSALLSLFVLTAAYWLAQELFANRLMSYGFVAIAAVSPFHILYAQEAREYSLWAVTILLSTTALVRSLRLPSLQNWGVYGVTVGLGLYAHPLSALVMIGHGLYMLLLPQPARLRRLRNYLFSSALGVALFSPWLIVLFQNLNQVLDNTNALNLDREGNLVLYWALNLSRIFVDVNQGPSAINPLHYLLVALVGFALYHLYRQTSPQVWLLVFTLIGVTGLAIILPDLFLGGRRSTIPRYIMPCVIGLQLAIAFFFTHALQSIPPKLKLWGWYRNGAIALVVCGLLSSAVSSQVSVWWNKDPSKSRFDPAAAALVNQTIEPLIVSDRPPGEILAFSHHLNPDAQWQLYQNPRNLTGLDEVQSVFLYKSSNRLEKAIATQGFTLKQIQAGVWLWSIQPGES